MLHANCDVQLSKAAGTTGGPVGHLHVLPAPSHRCFLVTSPVPRNHLFGSARRLRCRNRHLSLGRDPLEDIRFSGCPTIHFATPNNYSMQFLLLNLWKIACKILPPSGRSLSGPVAGGNACRHRGERRSGNGNSTRAASNRPGNP